MQMIESKQKKSSKCVKNGFDSLNQNYNPNSLKTHQASLMLSEINCISNQTSVHMHNLYHDQYATKAFQTPISLVNAHDYEEKR